MLTFLSKYQYIHIYIHAHINRLDEKHAHIKKTKKTLFLYQIYTFIMSLLEIPSVAIHNYGYVCQFYLLFKITLVEMCVCSCTFWFYLGYGNFYTVQYVNERPHKDKAQVKADNVCVCLYQMRTAAVWLAHKPLFYSAHIEESVSYEQIHHDVTQIRTHTHQYTIFSF